MRGLRSLFLGLCILGVAAGHLSFVSNTSLAGERAFSWTLAPARGDYIGVNMNPFRLGKYLAECEVNRPEIVSDVKDALARGDFYRKSTTDQKGKAARVTVNVTPDYMLRVVTVRDDTCPLCKGTGRKNLPFDRITKSVAVALKCHECRGKGVFEQNVTEKYYILSPEDFQDPREGRRIMKQRAFSNAPSGTEQWIERLVSKNPYERLEACEWLDQNYVRVGEEFQQLMPMLKKARYQEANEKRRIMVWQFWAGKDIPEERKRAFYRIYVNTKNGRVTQKGFFAAQ